MRKTFLVCGSRDNASPDEVNAALNAIKAKHGAFTLLSGACPHPEWHKDDSKTGFSADMLAIEWAIRNGIMFVGYPADWSQGKSAGPKRNQTMLMADPDGVIAFPGGAGTADMIRRAEAQKFTVWKVGKHA